MQPMLSLLLAILAPAVETSDYADTYADVKANGGTAVVIVATEADLPAVQHWLLRADAVWDWQRPPAIVVPESYEEHSDLIRDRFSLQERPTPHVTALRREDGKVVIGGFLSLSEPLERFIAWRIHVSKRHSTPAGLLQLIESMAPGELYEGYGGRKISREALIELYRMRARTNRPAAVCAGFG